MRSFKDFLLEKSISVSSRLLKENVEKDLYWLNVDFINYLYFIQYGKFNPKLTKGRQLMFVSEGSTHKSVFNEIFDYPVTLYFDKKNLVDFLDLEEEQEEAEPEEREEVSEEDQEETIEESPEEEQEEAPEKVELAPDYSISPDKFTFDISKNKDLLVKVELNYTPINELTLEQDFRNLAKVFTITFIRDTDKLKGEFKDRITKKTEQWLKQSKHTKVELVISD